MAETDRGQHGPSLEVSGIRANYGDVTALRDVSFTVRSGEWLGLLGPNGAGKTTLMRIFAGLMRPDSGSIVFKGNPADSNRNAIEPSVIGFVPQYIALYSSLTARENLEVFARFHGVAKSDVCGRAAWALDWTGLSERANSRVSTYSIGMKRRLNIACAVLHNPKLLLLDEPAVGVDPHARQRIWSMIRELRDDGAAIIHSSHQLDEVESTCDRVVILDRGAVRGVGSVEDLLRQVRGAHRVFVRFDSPPPDSLGPSLRVDGSAIQGSLSDPARDLSELLRAASESGLEVLDLRIESPRLEDLFSQLTGEELRE